MRATLQCNHCNRVILSHIGSINVREQSLLIEHLIRCRGGLQTNVANLEDVLNLFDVFTTEMPPEAPSSPSGRRGGSKVSKASD